MIEVRRVAEFDRWLARLRDGRARTKIEARLVRVRAGLVGDAKPVGSGVWELRVDVGPGYRLYYVRRGAALVVLLCGGDKGSQDRDILRAKAVARSLPDPS